MRGIVIGAGAMAALKTLFSKIAKPALISTILLAIFTLVPFNIALPQELVNVLLKGNVAKVFSIVSMFFPVRFFLTCFLTIFLSHYVSFFWNMITFVFNKISNFING